jgi:hypothetical protein
MQIAFILRVTFSKDLDNLLHNLLNPLMDFDEICISSNTVCTLHLLELILWAILFKCTVEVLCVPFTSFNSLTLL